MGMITDRIERVVAGLPGDAGVTLLVEDVRRLLMLARTALLLEGKQREQERSERMGRIVWLGKITENGATYRIVDGGGPELSVEYLELDATGRESWRVDDSTMFRLAALTAALREKVRIEDARESLEP